MYLRLLLTLLACLCLQPVWGRDLAEIRKEGVLRHLGVRYANFITGGGDGLEVDLMRGFAQHLGLRYQYVESTWPNIIGDLVGKDQEPRGDVIASGLTVLPERARVLDYGSETFPTAVWLVARSDAKAKPIHATGKLSKDISLTKERMKLGSTLTMPHTCLDPLLYNLDHKKLRLVTYTRSSNLNEMVPTILKGEAEMTLLDVPDIILALQRWPGQIKVIGPISEKQMMAPGFRKASPELRMAFNAYLAALWQEGTYQRMVKQYYPSLHVYFPEFFAKGK